MNSLLDFEIDNNEGDFGSEFEDPFTYSKQRILEEIMMEKEIQDSSIKKGRHLSSDEAFWGKTSSELQVINSL